MHAALKQKKRTSTIVSLVVMAAAKCVGTNPGAIQLTRVFGLISEARAYKKFR